MIFVSPSSDVSFKAISTAALTTVDPGRQTDTQAERHAGRQAGRQAGRHADRQEGRQAARHARRQVGRQAPGRQADR